MTQERRLKAYEVQVPIRAGQNEVWEAVTKPPMLRRWFGWDYVGLDAEIQQIFVKAVTKVARAKRMSWADGSYLEITGDASGSVVRAVREGPAATGPEQFDAIEEGWKAFLVQLRFLLEHDPQGVRRTIYLTGESTGQETLGLVDAEWQRVGSRVAWTVDADAHLVVAAGNRPLDSSWPGRQQITVSTYALSDAEFEACRDNWAKRWAAAADDVAVTIAGSPDPAG
ncbi:activator of HSP90 ATPase [Actinoplanes sp. NPDC049265]|uniref:activator of HSP90 ATPase n=1 Tax=Actinoplanes sp. NPDC049265 TaxID=3363902 RepID=UPI00370FBE50